MTYFFVILTCPLITSGTFADDTLRLIRDVQNRTLDDVVRIHEDLCTVVFSTSSAYNLWFLLHVFCHGVGYISFVTLIFFMTAHKFEQNTLTPEYVVSLVYVQLPFFYLFISPLMFAAWISSRCAGKKPLL